MQSLGFCCGRRHVFSPQVLCCFGKQLCAIPRDTVYYNYQDRYFHLIRFPTRNISLNSMLARIFKFWGRNLKAAILGLVRLDQWQCPNHSHPLLQTFGIARYIIFHPYLLFLHQLFLSTFLGTFSLSHQIYPATQLMHSS